MGISQQSLESRESAINSVATNLSLYLTALRSIIPREFSAAYRSPCWESPLALPERLPRGFYNLNKHNFTEWLKVRRHLYLSLILRALYSKERVLQCLPSFFLAGFPKCGTTTVHTALYHSRLIPELKKEPHWWTRMHLFLHDLEHLQVATARYLNYFYHVADTTVKENHQLLLYDGSQSTLWDSNFVFSDGQDYCAMPTAVSNILPSAKFIVVMREPASRTYSHYRYSCTMKRLETPGLEEFHDTAQADVDHFSQCLSANNTAFECASSISHKKTRCGTLGYRLMVSLYYIHLHKWLQFYPRENFLYLRLEDLARNPMAFMLRITKFLNIPNTKAIDFRWVQHHKQNKQMPYKSMLPETKVLLSKFFHPFNKKLVELTGDSGFLWQDI
jgi:N-acetylgalactosamine 4-sulfate 6-O-sulfotransferase